MSEQIAPVNEAKQKTPWHLWLVGVLGLLWSSMGVLDFVMTQSKNEAYMGGFSEAQLEYFYGFPVWTVICWAIAVFGGLLGAVLLLCRTGLAVPVFALSLVGFLATVVYNYVMTNALEITGTGAAIFTVVIFLVALFLLLYSFKMKQARVLR